MRKGNGFLSIAFLGTGRFLFLLLFLFSRPVLSTDEHEPISESALAAALPAVPTGCVGDVLRLIKSESRLVALSVGAVLVAPHLVGALVGYPFVGGSIFLDIENVENLLSDHEKELLNNSEKHASEITQLFNTKLNGDCDYGYLSNEVSTIYHKPILVSSLIQEPNGKGRGVCRHKAVALAALLNHYGIAASLRGGTVWIEGERHAFVYLPQSDEIADPTFGEILPATEYRRKHLVRYEFGLYLAAHSFGAVLQ